MNGLRVHFNFITSQHEERFEIKLEPLRNNFARNNLMETNVSHCYAIHSWNIFDHDVDQIFLSLLNSPL